MVSLCHWIDICIDIASGLLIEGISACWIPSVGQPSSLCLFTFLFQFELVDKSFYDMIIILIIIIIMHLFTSVLVHIGFRV